MLRGAQKAKRSHIPIGLLSPKILSTRYVSSTKKTTTNTKGARKYNVYKLRLRLGALSMRLVLKKFVQPKPVSSAMYPVPTKMRKLENTSRPKDNGVPSSTSWYPTMPLSISTQAVAVTAAM